MKSNELADELEAFIRRAQDRVTGVGDKQYSVGDTQHFEKMPIGELFDWAEEELLDCAAYATMLSLRLRAMRQQVERLVDNPSPLPWG